MTGRLFWPAILPAAPKPRPATLPSSLIQRWPSRIAGQQAGQEWRDERNARPYRRPEPACKSVHKMRVAQAASLVLAHKLALPTLWCFTTAPERIQIALILGRPTELPLAYPSPLEAWTTLNAQQRRLVQKLSPLSISSLLPAATSAVSEPAPKLRRRRTLLKPGRWWLIEHQPQPSSGPFGPEPPPAEPSSAR